MGSVRPKRLKKRQPERVGAVKAEFFNGLLEQEDRQGATLARLQALVERAAGSSAA